MTKTQLIQLLADRLDLPRTKVTLMFETLGEVTADNLKKDGVSIIPGLVKFTMKDKPATPERQGVNPFTKEKITIPAKAATKKIKTAPLNDLKRTLAL